MATKQMKPVMPPWGKGGAPQPRKDSPQSGERIAAKPAPEQPAAISAAEDARRNLLSVEAGELKGLLGRGRCVDRELFSLERFIKSISLVHARREGQRGAFYLSINAEDGKRYRLYPQQDNLASMEKLEKCDYVACIQIGGELLSLYRERD